MYNYFHTLRFELIYLFELLLKIRVSTISKTIYSRTLFGILRNVGNLFAQMDICELLMRYFYQLNRHFNVKSLFESSDDGWTVNGDVQMLCNFFNTMIDNMDLVSVYFCHRF